jgi:CRISPR/Cas system CSM-associated protein Csm3 (group 7 of RAMP superfamily)
MFGYGPEDDVEGLPDEAPDTTASRVQTRERTIHNTRNLVQQRVRIDRFTGGAYPGALFDQQPVFGGDDSRVKVELKLIHPGEQQGFEQDEEETRDQYHAEIGLLLLLLKDLWTSDLPLGGESTIGRGRLKGKCADLTARTNGEEKAWRVVAGDERLRFERGEVQELEEDYVTAFEDYVTAFNE